jgi:glycosyltransferase involved in cell wall biosynthesis
MKILHILSGFYPTQGGVETLVTSLSKELLSQHKVDSVFVAPRYWKSRPDGLTYKSHRVYSIDMVVHRGNKGSLELKTARAAMKSLNDLRKIFEIEKPDLVHVLRLRKQSVFPQDARGLLPIHLRIRIGFPVR